MKMLYFFKRKIKQIKNIFRWIPVLWNNFDFDYRYSLDVFKFQLLNQAKHMESDKSVTLNVGQYAKRIRTIVKLMDLVYDEYYACEYQDKLKNKYGEDVQEWIFEDSGRGDGSSRIRQNYEFWDNKDEVQKEHDIWFKESQLKQEKAHKLLWKLIEHNIRNFWD